MMLALYILTFITSFPPSPDINNQPISYVLSNFVTFLFFLRDNSVVVFFFCLLISTLLWLFGFNFVLTRSNISSFFRNIGVSSIRTKRAVIELKRKSFHLLGAAIPMIYYMGLKYMGHYLTQDRASIIMLILTILTVMIEILRLSSPSFHHAYSRIFGVMMRRAELDIQQPKATGMVFFFLGHLLCIFLFEPLIATCASLYLVLGDMAAAIVGISFGHIKIGNKSLEGSIAMWCVCLCIGSILFWRVRLGEYPIFVGASTATIVELLLPRWIDDNLSIPICSGIMLHLAFLRIGVTPPYP